MLWNNIKQVSISSSLSGTHIDRVVVPVFPDQISYLFIDQAFQWHTFTQIHTLTHTLQLYRDSRWRRAVEHWFDEGNGKNAWLCSTRMTHTHTHAPRRAHTHTQWGVNILSVEEDQTLSCEFNSLLNLLWIETFFKEKFTLNVSSE